MEVFERLPAVRLVSDGSSVVEAVVAREFFATIFLNGKELATLLCSPDKLDYLAAGFLFSEGLIKARDDIEEIAVDEKLGIIRVSAKSASREESRYGSPRLITSGCGGAASFYNTQDAALPKIESSLKVNANAIFAMVKAFQHYSPAYLATHGTHSAALCDAASILAFAEDVGRHNAIDKLFGKCLLEDIPMADRLVLTSGRISFEILQKVTRRGVPVIVSISAPMSLGIQMAEKLGITLVGSARGQSMYVFSHPERVVVTADQEYKV